MALIPGYFSGSLADTFRQYRIDKLLTIRKNIRRTVAEFTQAENAWYANFSRISRMFERLQTIGGTVRVNNARKFGTACAFAKIPIVSSGIATDIFCIGAIPERLFESIACHIIGVLESADEGLGIATGTHARLSQEQIHLNKIEKEKGK